jgi:four helix bundle suffix protein
VRQIGSNPDAAYEAYCDFCETHPIEVVANIAICLIHQTNYLLDRQLRQLRRDFVKNGGLRECMFRARREYRSPLVASFASNSLSPKPGWGRSIC